jgi:hypothetical protein
MCCYKGLWHRSSKNHIEREKLTFSSEKMAILNSTL